MKDNSAKKKTTVGMLDVMIEHADKGPSGFWTDDYEGCGNPKIFPEFNEGLQHGRLVQKEHFYCPWNTAIMYGDGHGNIGTGCYYSCSIADARYLSAEMLATVLKRFKKGVNSGRYDNINHIVPLLTADEQKYIQRQKERAKLASEQLAKHEAASRKKKAANLLQRYADDQGIRDMICAYYGMKEIVDLGNGAFVFFDPESKADVSGAERISYDDYLDAQIQSAGKFRTDFQNCYMNIPMEFKGEIERIDTTHKRLCFRRIYVTGMFSDGIFFDGKEDHVWMSSDGFGNCEVGDCFKFSAEMYRYLKTGNGRMIDYSLRNPSGVKKIDKYSLPTDKELAQQSISRIICETCYLSESCSRTNCLRNPKEIRALKRELLKSLGMSDNQGGH